MTFISYAQNFEDVMLWRALKHVPAGRYIDIGAQDPIVDSVSKAFYEHGWRGIHVEPVPQYAEMLRLDRPDETVLQLALSDEAGILEFNVFEGTGLSTAIKEFADSHRSRPELRHQAVRTPMLPMSAAFASIAGQAVHWLKIDVEGMEERVLRGWNSLTLRPWIIVIEATVPMSTELRHRGAEEILLAADYRFVYFDGLNRFYIAAEHPELQAAFSSPPNVFDGARLSGMANSELCRGLLETHRAETNALGDTIEGLRHEALAAEALARRRLEAEVSAYRRIRELEEQAMRDTKAASAALQLSESQREMLEHRLDAMLNSTSWKITAPMRSIGSRCRQLLSSIRDGRMKSGVKRRIRSGLRICALAVVKRPALKRGLLACMRAVPSLRRRLSAMLAPPLAPPLVAPLPSSASPPDQVASAMSPATHAVYLGLKAASGRH